MSNGELVEARGLVKVYGRGELAATVFDGANLVLDRGEILAVRGRSGSGKTTLLFLLGLLDEPSGGEILVEGRKASGLPGRERARLRNRFFGFVFQAYYLVPEMTALENVMLPMMVRHGPLQWLGRRREVRRRAKELLERFGLAARANYRPTKLSGGEQQRVAIARALVGSPEVLLCDEPTGNLDEETGEAVARQILAVTREEGKAAIIVTHDAALSAQADRIVRIERGRVYKDSGEAPAREA